MCVCVCERERERERVCVCVYVKVIVYTSICTHVPNGSRQRSDSRSAILGRQSTHIIGLWDGSVIAGVTLHVCGVSGVDEVKC